MDITELQGQQPASRVAIVFFTVMSANAPVYD
jgi:hypothetical protein